MAQHSKELFFFTTSRRKINTWIQPPSKWRLHYKTRSEILKWGFGYVVFSENTYKHYLKCEHWKELLCPPWMQSFAGFIFEFGNSSVSKPLSSTHGLIYCVFAAWGIPELFLNPGSFGGFLWPNYHHTGSFRCENFHGKLTPPFLTIRHPSWSLDQSSWGTM